MMIFQPANCQVYFEIMYLVGNLRTSESITLSWRFHILSIVHGILLLKSGLRTKNKIRFLFYEIDKN